MIAWLLHSVKVQILFCAKIRRSILDRHSKCQTAACLSHTLLWFCRSGNKTAAYFQNTIDVLANPGQDVLIYDVESWMVWKEVWDTFERDGVPKTDNLNDIPHGLFDI